MKNTLLFCLLLATLPALSAVPVPKPALGINLSGPTDWNTELPFVDVFRLSRKWISQRNGAEWGKGPELKLDEHGWVTQLSPDCFAETPLCTIDGGHYPSGHWMVLWEGDGKIEMSKGKVVSRSTGRMIVNITAEGGGFFLRLLRTNPENHVRNIRVLMPGFSPEVEARNPWNPKFLARWRGAACVRFMDFQNTNNSSQIHWADRAHPRNATFTIGRGIPVELLCDLANRLQADPWFCLPHRANDDYVRRFAKLAKARLDTKRKLYVEYSNEVWNSQFEQNRYAGEMGMKQGLAENAWEGAWRYTAQRSVEIFNIFESEFGGTERLVRVLSSQAANCHVSEQIATWNNAASKADALAIAPYISMNIAEHGNGLNAAEVAGWTVDRFLDHAESKALPESIRWMAANRKVAAHHRLKLVCYEAGQHFVGVAGGESNEALTALLHAANSHPRMKQIYRQYYSAWETNGGGLLCHFSSVDQWTKWGSWGLLQFSDEDPAQAPKFMATMEWAKKLGQPVKMP